jgi:hypothetical protein
VRNPARALPSLFFAYPTGPTGKCRIESRVIRGGGPAGATGARSYSGGTDKVCVVKLTNAQAIEAQFVELSVAGKSFRC